MLFSLQKTSKSWLSNWLRILILTQLFVASFGQPGCIRCEDFNRVQPPSCAQDYTQCGDCQQKFIQDPEDPRLCFAIEILTDADDELVQEANSEVYLICKFNTFVTCKWSKDGVEIKEIGPEFNHKWSTGSGANTEDCSLTIRNLSEEDVGSWVCSKMADSHMKEISSKPIQLFIQPTLIKNPDAYYNVEEGSSVTMACVFDHKVTCSWTKNNRILRSNDNYQFTANATNCSLTIGSVVPVDSGQWQCVAPGTSSRDSVSSKQTTLNVIMANIQGPLIYYGDKVVNGATLMYPGDEAMAELLSVQCELPGKMSSGHRLWWVLHDDREYQEQSNGPLYVGNELGMAIVQQLKLRDKIELICMAEDGSKLVSTANVFFIAGISQSEVAAAASSFDTIIIVMFVFIVVLVLAVIWTMGILIWVLRNKNPNDK